MLELFMDKFMALIPMQLPELINRAWMEEPDIYDDYALLVFTFPNEYSLVQVIEKIEQETGLILLYHKVSSDSTSFGHYCCAYSNPDFGHMYKINAATNGKGVVNNVTVTIYESLEFMCGDLCNEVLLHSKSGYFKSKREKPEILANFI